MRRLLFPLVSAGMLLTALTAAPAARADQSVYVDSLQNGWSNYSWASVNFSSPSPVHGGADSVSVDAGAYQALYLHHGAFDDTAYTNLVFWINGGAAGGQTLQVAATLSGTSQTAYPLPALTANTWTQVVIPLSALGVAGKTTLDGFWIQSTSGSTLPTFYVDDIALAGGPVAADPSAITVDAAANRHSISPLIYGVAFADSSSLSDLNVPLNRSGGNAETRYNWKINATNHASDYFFESIGDTSANPGQDGDDFITGSKAAGAQSMLTIPTIGWVATLGPSRAKLGAFSVAKYGPQQSTDPYMPDSGNGVKSDGTNIVNNDPTDANIPSDVNFQGGWIDHLVATWGQAAKGGVAYYLMDNEPSIWHQTHRDVHPVGETMSEELTDIETYGGRVKSADPTAQVAAPEEWGWSGYFNSGYDLQYQAAHNYQGSPDKDSHKVAGQPELDYVPWLLQQLAAHDQQTGQRTLDIFSLHFYPQGNEFSTAADDATALLRNRSTRQLWDPNYTSESWINSQIMLIPRMKNWVNTYYPGTKTGITEYNWGAESDINGATTQADIDGIFGREGLDLATRWTTPASNTPTYTAMKMYRNYDGQKSAFGDTSVADTVANADNVSSFASVRTADGALTIMVINKELHTSAPINLTLKNFSAGGSAQTWQLTSANSITRLADTPVTGGLLSASLPSQSITLYVVPPVAQTAVLTPTADAYVQAGTYANTSYGGSTVLALKKIGSPSNQYDRVSYLKFDLTRITRAPKTAVLTLTLSGADNTAHKAVSCKVYGIANSSWTETGLTWNIAAASESLNGSAATSAGTYIAATNVGPALKTYTWDVSSYLKSRAGGLVTLQVIDESGAGAYCGFSSKEAATGKPTLTVTY